MVYLETANFSVSDHVRERSKAMWTKTLDPHTYLVRPKSGGKAKRVVRIERRGKRIAIECVDKDTGEPCPANRFKLMCSHANAAITRLLTNVKRQQNRNKNKREESITAH